MNDVNMGKLSMHRTAGLSGHLKFLRNAEQIATLCSVMGFAASTDNYHVPPYCVGVHSFIFFLYKFFVTTLTSVVLISCPFTILFIHDHRKIQYHCYNFSCLQWDA